MAKPNAAPPPAPSFESRLDRLEAIVHELEGDQVELARALELFEEGVECLRAASKELADARAKGAAARRARRRQLRAQGVTWLITRSPASSSRPSSPKLRRIGDRIDVRSLACVRSEFDASSIQSAPRVADAIRYSLLGGGKRFRGILSLAAYRAAGGETHAPSLGGGDRDRARLLARPRRPAVHGRRRHASRPSDRPQQVRRADRDGRRARDGATGGAEPRQARREGASASRSAARIVAELMSAAGAGGMIGGQLLDLEGEGKPLSLCRSSSRFTARRRARWSRRLRMLGGIAAGRSEPVVQALAHYGAALGLAFQIADDVLDVTGSTEDAWAKRLVATLELAEEHVSRTARRRRSHESGRGARRRWLRRAVGGGAFDPSPGEHRALRREAKLLTRK